MATPLPTATAGGWNANGHQLHHQGNSNSSNSNNVQIQNHGHNQNNCNTTTTTTTATSTATTMTPSTTASTITAPTTMTPNPNMYSNNNNNHGNGIYHGMVGMPAASEVDEYGVQTRTMGLKVHYTFDKEAKVQCLARCPQLLQIQTAPIDDRLTIGLVDLRTCIHVITEASPEITHQDCDYTIYAVDHSEPDLPLVGYGLLSWTIDSLLRGNPMGQPPKMVTGRVARNVLGVFAGGSRETLEVRLKLSEMAKPHRPVDHPAVEQTSARPLPAPAPAPTETAMTPTGHSEWASFLQSNPQIGQPVTQLAQQPAGRELFPRTASPAISRVSQGLPPGPPPPIDQPDLATSPVEHRDPTQDLSRIAPTPVDLGAVPPAPATTSRPSSRTSNKPPRRKPPTGRPRGRPRKKPTEGNTSGYEDGTEGEEPREEGPAKKRVKTTVVEKADPNPFNAAHESLRVAASNSSSLRNFRPQATNAELSAAVQSQELPRAPTPVPQGRFRGASGQGGNHPSRMRQESRLSQPPSLSYSPSYSEPRQPMSPSLDGRSPESLAPTPNYSEGSPLEIGSSPPIPRMMPFIRSSPPPSSPVLPPMPMARPPRETTFTNHELDSLIGEEQAQPQIDEEGSPPPPPVGKESVQQINGVPVQVYQIQDGPSGQDLVHVRSYTTPHPSSSALVPPEVSALPLFVPDLAPAPPVQPKRAPSKRRKAPPKAPAIQPPTPPTTDAAELVADPVPAAAAPVAETNDDHMALDAHVPVQDEGENALPTTASPQLHTQARLELNPAPEPQEDFEPKEKNAPDPVPKSTQIASPPIDLSQDPVLQLALSFGMREVSVPKSLPPQPSPPLVQESFPDLPQSEPSPEPELPPVPPPPASQTGKTSRESRPKYHRPLNRSQSAGPLTLPMPAVPASEPSPLSRTSMTAPEPSRPISNPTTLRRAASIGPLVLPVLENATADIAIAPPSSTLRESCSPGENTLPPSSPQGPRSNKNIVKKHAIKQRLEQAIINGEMPPFCTNCGAIETPTWRKIWVQEKEGEPEDFEFSEKPGKVTAVEIIQRDKDDKPTLHRIIKKSLALLDDRKVWQEMLLCNPCGIWLSKSKSHRPPDRWEKDLSRLGQERRRRGTSRTNPRPKKPRLKDGVTRAHAVSEGYIPSDAIEPVEPSSPPKLPDTQQSENVGLTSTAAESDAPPSENEATSGPTADDVDGTGVAGSPNSRGSGTAQRPIDIEFDEAVGSTRRLLFPTPRKDGLPKALSDVDINTVQLSEPQQQLKGSAKEKQKHASPDLERATEEQDDLEDLFRSPGQPRPSTPPPGADSAPAAPMKTPTRRTPNHRPITRSVSRSLRSSKSKKSPGHPLTQRTPTKATGATLAVPGSNSNTRRRSPRLNQGGFEDAIFNTPISRRIAQMLTDQNDCSLDGQELDYHFSALESQDREGIDFANILGAEGAALGSPAKQGAIGFDYDGAANFWPNWNLENAALEPKE